MKAAERFLRCYAHGDWIARLVLTTCFGAALNFLILLSRMSAEYTAAVREPFVIVCHFGPAASFFPRLMVLGALLVATLAAFPRTMRSRVVCSAALLGALAVYANWWVYSRNAFQNFDVNFLNYPELRRSPYLFQGSWLDFGVALSLVVCLAMVLDRLFDGEKLHGPGDR